MESEIEKSGNRLRQIKMPDLPISTKVIALLFTCFLITNCTAPSQPEINPAENTPAAKTSATTPAPDNTHQHHDENSAASSPPVSAPASTETQPTEATIPANPKPAISTPATNLKTDENVLVFPTNAVFDNVSQRWKLNIHGWVFEPETDSLWRKGLISSLALFVGVDKKSDDGKRFKQRTAMFLVDNERSKNIVLSASGSHFTAPTTGTNGHFEFNASLPQGSSHCKNWLTLKVQTRDKDQRRFSGKVQCVQHTGISVISDIDDTIKNSNVLDKKKLLKKTFLKEFSAVKGMSTLYRHWNRLGYQFHYVSSSPWQLYPVLNGFIDTQSFPHGSMHLKLIRVKDSSIFNLLATPEEGKIPTITKLMEAYPKRRFILVGDSGEKDANIYATIAKKYSDRIIKIYIHNVTGDHDKARIEAIFMSLPQKQWVVFTNTSEILSQHALLNPDN